jgi:xylose dehydrogenase (NAD/NADP)
MKKVRWGLLSTAHINRRLIPVIRNSPRGELTAIASRRIDQARRYAQHWEIPKIFGSYQDMLSSGSVDAVYISLPNHLHAEWSVRALEAGVHVLCEKPFALTLEDVDRVIQASQKFNRHIAEAFMYRHHPQTKITGEWVHSGKLGEITMVRGVFTFALQDRDNVRLVPEFGGGSLWDVGVYPMSFSQFIFGCLPIRVSAIQYLGPSGVDESFAGQMEYPGGGIAQISCSLRSPFNAHFEILGTTGRLDG